VPACGCGGGERAPFYPADLTYEEWAVLETLLPSALCGTELGGQPEKHRRRTMVDVMLYVAGNGVKWRALPADFPPWQTVYPVLARWRRDGMLALVRDRLRRRVRAAAGRDPQPSTAVTGSQSVHESVGGVVPTATSGYDSHKKVNGRKRHLMTDTAGQLLDVVVSPAGAQDRDGAAALLARARRRGLTRLALAWPTAATPATPGSTGPAASSASRSRSSAATRRRFQPHLDLPRGPVCIDRERVRHVGVPDPVGHDLRVYPRHRVRSWRRCAVRRAGECV
jgi:transposase